MRSNVRYFVFPLFNASRYDALVSTSAAAVPVGEVIGKDGVEGREVVVDHRLDAPVFNLSHGLFGRRLRGQP